MAVRGITLFSLAFAGFEQYDTVVLEMGGENLRFRVSEVDAKTRKVTAWEKIPHRGGATVCPKGSCTDNGLLKHVFFEAERPQAQSLMFSRGSKGLMKRFLLRMRDGTSHTRAVLGALFKDPNRFLEGITFQDVMSHAHPKEELLRYPCEPQGKKMSGMCCFGDEPEFPTFVMKEGCDSDAFWLYDSNHAPTDCEWQITRGCVKRGTPEL
jgi:hypothetical protein